MATGRKVHRRPVCAPCQRSGGQQITVAHPAVELDSQASAGYSQPLSANRRNGQCVRQHPLKQFVRRHSDIFNPIWPLVYPIIRRGGGEIASNYDENLEAFSKIYADILWETPEVPQRSGEYPRLYPLAANAPSQALGEYQCQDILRRAMR